MLSSRLWVEASRKPEMIARGLEFLHVVKLLFTGIPAVVTPGLESGWRELKVVTP